MRGPAAGFLPVADGVAFLFVAFLALRGWWWDGDRTRGLVALALGCLGLVGLGLALEMMLGVIAWLTTAVIVCFVLSGAGLMLYRHALLRLPPWALGLGFLGLAGAAAFSLVAGLPSARLGSGLEPLQLAAIDLLLVVWCLTVAEPAYRLARLSSALAPVQRARAISLVAGYGGIIAVAALTLVAVALRASPLAVISESVALGCVLPLYVGLASPGWLRWTWRHAEDVRLRRAIHDLLLSSSDRETLAGRALEWAIRLVGAEAGLVADADGELLAVQGLTDQEVRALKARASGTLKVSLLRIGPGPRTAIVQRLPLQTGSGLLVVTSGLLSPTFSEDEVQWVSAYAASMAIALDRARVAELTTLRERQLQQAHDLAVSASRAKSEFLSRMSHELRTPLTAVIGFAELMLMEEPDEPRSRHLHTILKAGEHLLDLINDVLDIARIEEGAMALSLGSLSLAPLLAEALDLTRPMADQRRVTVQTKIPADGLSVIADHQRLKQVLVNMVSNAIKYNRVGGSVEIAASVSTGMVRITVRDTGPGLRPEEMDHLFSPFERLSAATSGIEGTGLGLAVSKSLVEAMGGRIGVDSTVGAGSVFWFELPLPEPQLPGAEGDLVGGVALSESALPPSLVLYVEDTASNVRLVERLVAHRPELTLISAPNGGRGIEMAHERRPDLILLDAHLPDMDGVEVLRQLVAEPATAAIPVVVFSADATQAQIDRFLGAGAREYLTKPIRLAELVRALERHLLRPAAVLTAS